MSKGKIRTKNHMVILGIGALCVLTFLVCLGLGRFYVPIGSAARILADHVFPGGLDATWTDQMRNVIINIRLPRVAGAMLVGGALSLSGATYQGVFKNPLISPDLLGVSSGACVGASLGILLGRSALEIQFFAFIFGLIAVFAATMIPRAFKNNSNLMFVLSGIIVAGFMSAIQGFIKYVADPMTTLQAIVYWTMGSLSSVKTEDVFRLSPAMIVAGIVLLAIRWRINLLSLGDYEAKSLGVNIPRIRGISIICATVLTAGAVCMSGTIMWAGLVMPHLSRLLVGEDNRYLLPASVLLGMAFMTVMDTIARNLTGSEIPLSIVTGLLGAPLFLWLMIRQKTRIT